MLKSFIVIVCFGIMGYSYVMDVSMKDIIHIMDNNVEYHEVKVFVPIPKEISK